MQNWLRRSCKDQPNCKVPLLLYTYVYIYIYDFVGGSIASTFCFGTDQLGS